MTTFHFALGFYLFMTLLTTIGASELYWYHNMVVLGTPESDVYPPPKALMLLLGFLWGIVIPILAVLIMVNVKEGK